MCTVLNNILFLSVPVLLWRYEQGWAGSEQGLISQVCEYDNDLLAACPCAIEYLLSNNSQSDDFSVSLFTTIRYNIIMPFSWQQ
jgi:hypothetical protein